MWSIVQAWSIGQRALGVEYIFKAAGVTWHRTTCADHQYTYVSTLLSTNQRPGLRVIRLTFGFCHIFFNIG